MADGSHSSPSGFGLELAEALLLELGQTQDLGERVSLSRSLAIIFGDGLGKWDEACTWLEAAVSDDPGSVEVLWDEWRVAIRRGPEHKIAALEKLSSVIASPDLLARGLARLYHIRRRSSLDPEGGQAALVSALEAAPDNREARLADVQAAFATGNMERAIASLESLAKVSQDCVLRASLLSEVAYIKERCGHPVDEISSVLDEALVQPDVGWLIVNHVLRSSARIGDWVLHEGALRKLADMAVGTDSLLPTNGPAGQAFLGYERSPGASAAFWWFVARVRERKLDRPEAAVDAIRMARGYLSSHELWELEICRLLEARGHLEEALEAMPANASPVWKARLLLMAEKPDLVAPLLCSEEMRTSIVMGGAINDLAVCAEELPFAAGTDPVALERWLLSHPGHSAVGGVAHRLLESNCSIPILQHIVEEKGRAGEYWPTGKVLDSHESWASAARAVIADKAELDGTTEFHLVQWANGSTDSVFRAILLAVAGYLTEMKREDSAVAVDLFRESISEIPTSMFAWLEQLRILRENGRFDELDEALADFAARQSDPKLVGALRHERALVLEHSLGKKDLARILVEEISDGDDEDVGACLSSALLAHFAKDRGRVAEHMEKLAILCPEDAAWIKLFIGEVCLFTQSDYARAYSLFETASASSDAALGHSGRIYRLLVLYLLGDSGALDQALQEEALLSDEQQGLWLAETLETTRLVRGAGSVLQTLEMESNLPTSKILWLVLTGAVNPDRKALVRGFNMLADSLEPGALAGSCRAAASLASPFFEVPSNTLPKTDFESEEALWFAADRLDGAGDPLFTAELFGKRAELADRFNEYEWVDWMLGSAEAFEEAGRLDDAFDAIEEAVKRSPSHPGLLESQARIGFSLGRHAEAIDAHKKLARFYEDDLERASQLSFAAVLSADCLKDEKAAVSLCKEALRLAPGYGSAHDLLVRILAENGDDEQISLLIEKRINATKSAEELPELYCQQARQFSKMSQTPRALEAVGELLSRVPDSTDGHLIKIDLTFQEERWEDTVDSIREFIAFDPELDACRQILWRGSDLLSQKLDDVESAIAMLEDLLSKGDTHPESFRRLAGLYRRVGRWEEAASTLDRFGRLSENESEKIVAWREEADIRLRHLFDDDAAGVIIERVLEIEPTDITTLRLLAEFKDAKEREKAISRARQFVLAAWESDLSNISFLEQLREIAEIDGDKSRLEACEQALAVFEGESTSSDPMDPRVVTPTDPDGLRRMLSHTDEIHPAAAVVQLSSAAANEVFADSGHIPRVGRSTLVGRKTDDSVKKWLELWGEILGFEAIEVHRMGSVEAEVNTAPGLVPAVVLGTSVQPPLELSVRFSLVSALWRSFQGLGMFIPGDTAGPIRWVMAVVAAVLDEGSQLPLATDMELVEGAKKNLSRKQKKALLDPCRALLAMDAKSIRAWATAAATSADCAGLLASGNLSMAIWKIVEDTADESGISRVREKPMKYLLQIPRCVELIRFSMSDEYFMSRCAVGFDSGEETSSQ